MGKEANPHLTTLSGGVESNIVSPKSPPEYPSLTVWEAAKG